MQRFTLIPFPAYDSPRIQVRGEIERLRERLSIHYSITGELHSILLPSVSDLPARKNELWKATCFEFFVALKEQPHYWEFNLSPSGDWNVYGLDEYRQVNMQEETAFTRLPFEFRSKAHEYSLAISVNLSPILKLEQVLQIGTAAVIQSQDGSESYWALAHPVAQGAQADFHLRESFLIEL